MAGPASGGPIFSLRERKDWGEKSAFRYGLVPRAVSVRDWFGGFSVYRLALFNVALRAALQLELDWVAVTF